MKKWVVNVKEHEVSIVRDDSEFCKESYGWASFNEKHIIWDAYFDPSEEGKALAIEMAAVTAGALNEKGL